jgi:hypothetical protein
VIDRWHREGTLPTRAEPVLDPMTGQVDVAASEAAAAKAAGRTGPGQRQHLQALALAHIVDAFLGSDQDSGGERRSRPGLNLTVDLADLLARRGSGELHQPGAEPVPVPVSTVARIACDADITLILSTLTPNADDAAAPAGTGASDAADGGAAPAGTGGCDAADGGWGFYPGSLLALAVKDVQDLSRELLWLGRTRRNVPTRLWKALVARDGHCQFPACRVGPDRCHPHHAPPWEHHGTTDLDKIILLCARHHRMVHARDWRITPTPGKTPFQTGYWTILPPLRTHGPPLASAASQ